MLRRIHLIGSFISLLFVLLACGSSGSNQSAGIDGSGAPIATATSGTIDGFGSVIVNGLRYQSDRAQILINGENAVEDNLRVGYQVRITGSIAADGTATADKIEFTPTLVGSITQINSADNSLTLLGQTVYLTNNTLLDAAISPKSLAGLAVGNTILVSGSLTADASVSATRIELISANQIQLTGFVRELNESNYTFKLNQQQVSFAVAQLINVDNNRLQNGMLITAIGALNNSNELSATSINKLNTYFPTSTKNADIEGFITRFASTTDFDVAGSRVTTNNQTRYENGTSANLILGAKIELKGSINDSGQLVAGNIEFELAGDSILSGTVTSLQITNLTGIVSGRLEVGGTMIQTTSSTRYEDNGNSQLKRFNLGAIQIGDYLEITGYFREAEFIATKIEREEPDDDSDDDKGEDTGEDLVDDLDDDLGDDLSDDLG
jgi:Domain of unknown function (DUF5666)